MSVKSRRYPVVLSVPVNLRTYFPSVTARNFFGTISIRYDFDKNSDKLEDIINEVKACFERELTQEKLSEHMNRLIALEHNAFMRIVPLAVKDVVLKFANYLNNRGITATLSNVGRIKVNEKLEPYISMFNCFNSARRPQIAICSYKDKLVVSFASPFEDTDIQKNFYRSLTAEGVNITISTNAW